MYTHFGFDVCVGFRFHWTLNGFWSLSKYLQLKCNIRQCSHQFNRSAEMYICDDRWQNENVVHIYNVIRVEKPPSNNRFSKIARK